MSFAALVAGPERVADVPVAELPALVLRLAALQAAVAARLAAPPIPVKGADAPTGEYLTVAQAAALVKLSVKTVRNKMSEGEFEKGVHWFRPRGSGRPRFKRSALLAWLEQRSITACSAAPAPAGRAYAGLPRVDRRPRCA